MIARNGYFDIVSCANGGPWCEFGVELWKRTKRQRALEFATCRDFLGHFEDHVAFTADPIIESEVLEAVDFIIGRHTRLDVWVHRREYLDDE